MLKKYANRRLYDTEAGTYVTIADIRARLLAGELVQTKEGEDITVEVLVALIHEDHNKGIGPEAEILRRFIRAYSTPKPKAVAQAV